MINTITRNTSQWKGLFLHIAIKWKLIGLYDCFQHPAKRFNLFLSVVVVDGGADEAGETASLHVEQGGTGGSDGDVDIVLAQGLADDFGVSILDAEGDNAALRDAPVAHDDAGERAEPGAQGVGEVFDAPPRGGDVPLQGVVDGDAEANFCRVVGLPVLEAARIGSHFVAVSGRPLCRVQVEHGRLEPVEDTFTRVEEAGAARPAQVFATRRREQIAADLPDIDRHLPHRLAGVDKVENTGLAGDFAHFGHRIDKPAVGWHVRDGDEFDALIDGVAQGLDGDLAVRIVGDDLDGRTRALRHLQISDVVAGVLGHRGEDALAGWKGDGVESHIPGARGIFDDGYLIARTADQGRDGIIDVFDGLLRLFRRLVAACARLALQVSDDGIQHRLRHKRGPGIVQVQHLLAARRLLSCALQIKSHSKLLPIKFFVVLVLLCNCLYKLSCALLSFALQHLYRVLEEDSIGLSYEFLTKSKQIFIALPLILVCVRHASHQSRQRNPQKVFPHVLV